MPGGAPSGGAVPQYSPEPGRFGAPGAPGYGAPHFGGYPPAARTPTASPTDLGIAACGLALFGFSFAPMAKIDGYASELLNAWHAGFRAFLIVALLGLGLGVVSVLKSFELTPIPDRMLSFKLDQLAVVVGFVGLVVSLGNVIGAFSGMSVGWGSIITLLVSAGLTALGVVNLKTSGDL